MFILFLICYFLLQQLRNEPDRSRLTQSRSKEQISDEKANFFEKSSKEVPQQQKSAGYTREYSYNIDSETLRHSGQSDPRGLGFSYEKSSAPTGQSTKSAPQKHKGTALAFTYNPQNPSNKSDEVSERAQRIQQQKDTYSTGRLTESRQIQPPKVSYTKDDRAQQTKSKSPEIRGEVKQSNIDESSELSATSQESMVDEYAKESMRQKTSALIAGSAANTAPTTQKSSIYKTPSTLFSPQNTSSQTRSKIQDDNEQYPRFGTPSSQTQSKQQQRSSLWGQDAARSPQNAISRLPVLSPTEPPGVDRQYTHISRKKVTKNADGSVEEREEIIEPESSDQRLRTVGPRPSSSVIIKV